MCWLVGFMICQFLLGYLIPKSSFFVCALVGWFYDMSTLVGIFNTKALSFLFVCWLVGFMVCQFLLRYVIPKSSFLFLCWLVGFMICQLLLGYLIPKSTLFLFVCWLVGFRISQLLLGYLMPKSSFSVRVLVGWFYYMSILIRIFNTNVFFFCLCVGWLVL